MDIKIRITCQCGHDQVLTLNFDNEIYQCQECEKLLFNLHVDKGDEFVPSDEKEEKHLKMIGEESEQKQSKEKKDLMQEFNITEQEILEIESEISDEDRKFYEGLSEIEILKKKIWEYKNW